MRIPKLHKLNAAVGRFLSKASKRNEPLEAFRDTEAFTQLQDLIESGLKKQANFVKRNIAEFEDLQNPDLTDSQFEAEFGKWLNRVLPPIREYVSAVRVYTYLHNAFLFSIQASYLRLGVMTKAAGPVDFDLTNPFYIAKLKDAANYLLNKSNIDETTRMQLIRVVRDNRLERETIDEVASLVADRFDEISPSRAFMIANTETNRAMSTAQGAFLRENGVKTKKWVAAGPSTCSICQANEDDGEIGIDNNFNSGDSEPPAHPRCECYLDGGFIDLDTIPILWDGS